MENESDLVTIVSCDIVGHSSADENDQLVRVAAINSIVAQTIARCAEGDVIWASGGDGGHVVFRRDAWRQPAIDLVCDLRTWSANEGVPLRITCHRGSVSHVAGADGRVQVVGSGINYAGWLLAQVDEGTVVSAEFRRALEEAGQLENIEFHDPLLMLGNREDLQRFDLMSSESSRSDWGSLLGGDHAALEHAVRANSDWDVLYYAKRIWQASSADKSVTRSVRSVDRSKLTFWDAWTKKQAPNPFMALPQPDELVEMLKLGMLVERRRGEFICRHGDPGDSLFMILRGEVGVFNSDGEHVSGVPTHRVQRGGIVGELAYALSSNRTADLVALTEVALLSFRYEDVRRLLAKDAVGSAAARSVSSFINGRVLEHVSGNAQYLLGPDRDGPLSLGGSPWGETLASLGSHCDLVTVRKLPVELTVGHVSPSRSKARGVYILAAGRLEKDGRVLDGADFPVLWVDLPHLLPLQPVAYAVRSNLIKVLWIGARGIDDLDPAQKEALRRELKAAVAMVAHQSGATGDVVNRVEGSPGIVIQAGRIDGDIHLHPKPRDVAED